MFKRLLSPKRSVKINYNISIRNICSFIRYSNHNHLSKKQYITNISITNRNNTLLPHQHIRYFSKNIRVYNQPDVGEGTVEVDILEWLIKPGDKVKALQTIGRGKYEKADVDILAPTYDAVVHKLLVQPGDIAIVGKPLLEFEVDDDGTEQIITHDKTDNTTSSTISAKQVNMNANNANILALPSTKRYAKENNIDLTQVIGTGKDGRILKEDLMSYLDGKPTRTMQTPQTPSQTIKGSIPIPPKALIQHKQDDYVEKIVGIKKAMVRKMTEANRVPQFGYSDEIIMNELIELRKSLKTVGDMYGIKITYLPFILKATSLALLNPSYTCLNGYINDDCTELIHKNEHNIGVAIDSAEGLIVPNIKNIESKNILQIAKDLDALIDRAKNNKITPDDITNGTITLSNIGAIGGTYCRPICFVPEVCIAALGAIKSLPRYNNNNELYAASVMAVSWSADHRVIDGATMARFSNEFKQYLENPASMLLHLK